MRESNYVAFIRSLRVDTVLVSIIYNQEKEVFEDIANTANVKESLYYLKSLYDANIISTTSMLPYLYNKQFIDHKLATLLDEIGARKTFPGYDYMNVSHSLLLKSDFFYQIPVFSYGGFYAVLKDTTNDQIESFISAFLRDDLYDNFGGEAKYLFDYPYKNKSRGTNSNGSMLKL